MGRSSDSALAMFPTKNATRKSMINARFNMSNMRLYNLT